MSKAQWTAVDHYLTSLFVPPDNALDYALKSSVAANLPPINVSPCQGKLLMLLTQMQAAKKILEIGTLGGYSTLWLARGLPHGQGLIVTLEADPRHADVASQNILNAKMEDRVQIVRGPALQTLPTPPVAGQAPFDLIFIDADKPNNPGYFEWALKLSRPGTLIIIDNVIRDGAVADSASKDPGVQGVRRMNDIIAAEKRVTATVIQTVGQKGYDGFALVRVNGD
jgi:predicted O-methyltransferase YrrM